MSKITNNAGPCPEDIFGTWRPRWRATGVLLVVLAGLSLWTHATVSPQWYEAGVIPVYNLARLTGALLIIMGLAVAIPGLLMPWSERSAAKSPLVIGIDSNRLYLEGRGKLSGRTQFVKLSGDAAFSDVGHYISDPQKLSDAVESSLMNLKTRLKPFVFVMPFDDGQPRSLTNAERQLIAGALSDTQVFEFVFIGHDSPRFDRDLPSRVIY